MRIVERMLFQPYAGSSSGTSMPQGAYVCNVFMRQGYVHIASLEDDTQPYVMRMFICANTAMYNIGNQNKRKWVIGRFEVTDGFAQPMNYYLIEEER